jgi:hypothetical protein
VLPLHGIDPISFFMTHYTLVRRKSQRTVTDLQQAAFWRGAAGRRVLLPRIKEVISCLLEYRGKMREYRRKYEKIVMGKLVVNRPSVSYTLSINI